MSEVRIKDNESLESALRRFKSSAQEPALLLRCARERLMKSPPSSARRSLKRHVSVSLNNLPLLTAMIATPMKSGHCARFLNIRQVGRIYEDSLYT